MKVYDIANKLANEIKNTREYKEFKHSMDIINEDNESIRLLREYRSVQLNVQKIAMSGQKLDKKYQRKIGDIQKSLSSNEKANKYLQAEYKFTNMMDNINKILAQAVENDYKIK